MRSLFQLVAVAVLPLFAMAAQSQDLLFHYGHTGTTYVFDGDNLPEVFRQPDANTKQLAGTRIAWTITYQDVVQRTGQGFDDPVLGGARRAVVERVLRYIDSVLNENGRCDVAFDISMNNPQDSTLAAFGAFRPTTAGYSLGYPQLHIASGIDPDDRSVDMSGNVNWGFSYHLGEGFPPSDQHDLFTLLLHEIFHGLGFSSGANADGSGNIGINAYQEFDKFIQTGGGRDLYDDFAPVPTFLGMASDFTGNDNGLFFVGQNAIASINPPKQFQRVPQLYAPNPYEEGSSVSHWDPTAHPQAVMTPGQFQGSASRVFTPVDIGALRDLGYPNAVEPGNSGCFAPGIPTGVQASDGAFGDRVRITWNPVAGAAMYNVFRNTVNDVNGATLLGNVPGTIFDDFTAKSESTPVQPVSAGVSPVATLLIALFGFAAFVRLAPQRLRRAAAVAAVLTVMSLGLAGCPPLGPPPGNATFFYFVQAVNSCGTSANSLIDAGNRF